jgi:D-alanyl-D-alanine carboxypeptidase/D-alanyl-D-alanine-endopeptidase (penicillin-binding protein 4)
MSRIGSAEVKATPARQLSMAAFAALALITAEAKAAPQSAPQSVVRAPELPRPVSRAFLDAGVPLNGVAIVVQEVSKKKPLFTHQPERPYNPASVMKLVTTFAALDLLGPDYSWKTFAYLDGPLDAGGTLHGNLVLKGGGDPKITIERWQAFMAMLRANGLAAIDGDLVLDRTFFGPIAHDPAAFDGEPLKPYNVGPTRCSSTSKP